ncbi:Alpha/Beta hydrolase protein [Syncephalis plumigaleata]|nr:Alpha/Beta hydrolase protein [Syncephalis plumigaleata]
MSSTDDNSQCQHDANVVRTETWVEHDSHQFYTVTYEPKDQPVKATLTVVHGIGEHIDRFDHLMRAFAQIGVRSHGYDQRGFGKTGQRNGIPGHTEGFKTVLNDVEAANKRVRVEYGHSMGGMIVLNYGALCHETDPVDGIIATGPAIALHKSVRPGVIKRTGLMCLAKILPTLHINPGLNANHISQDKEIVAAYIASEYNVSYATLRTLKDLMNNGEALLTERYAYLKTPLLIVHEFFNKLPNDMDKEIAILEDQYHEVHNEIEKEKAINIACQWIEKHIQS